MHDAPLAVDLAQTHGQSKLKGFPLTVGINVDALSCGRRESNILPAGDLHVVKVKGDRLLARALVLGPAMLGNAYPRHRLGKSLGPPLVLISRARKQVHEGFTGFQTAERRTFAAIQQLESKLSIKFDGTSH